MTYNALSGFRKWLNRPLVAVPTLSSQAQSQVRKILSLTVAAAGFFIFVALVSSAVHAIKANGLTWLAVGFAAAEAFLSSATAVPVLLLLILIALWHRNSSLASLRAEVEELTQNLEELEERIDRIAPTVREEHSDV